MRALLFLLLTVNSLMCNGQSNVVDQLKAGSWVSNEQYVKNGASMRRMELKRLTGDIESLTDNSTIWTFRDDLTIDYFDKSKGQKCKLP